MGRIILAHLPAERVERLYAGVDLRPVTPHTAVTPLQLHAQLQADRSLGLAWSDGNYESGISSVAAAIFDAANAPVAALNVSGQSAQFAGAERRTQIAAAVRNAAREISLRLGWCASLQSHAAGNHESVAVKMTAVAADQPRERSWT
jgi:DNA-binding IclR family transcriptional regulator